MTEKELAVLWQRLSKAARVDYLDYDEAVVIGNVFGELKAEVNRLTLENKLLTKLVKN